MSGLGNDEIHTPRCISLVWARCIGLGSQTESRFGCWAICGAIIMVVILLGNTYAPAFVIPVLIC